MLKLVKEPDPILKSKAEPWDFNSVDSEYLANLEQNMIDLMVNSNGIGLAANQIGMLKRVFVIQTQDGKRFGCFNPAILLGDGDSIEGNEGCLSFPNLWLKVKRYQKITAMYLDNAGEKRIIELEGIDARCFQHELDHLDGVCFTEYVSDLKLKMARKKQRKLNG